jgi:hypothetical protein
MQADTEENFSNTEEDVEVHGLETVFIRAWVTLLTDWWPAINKNNACCKDRLIEPTEV